MSALRPQPRPQGPLHQHGAALLTAMVIVTLVATLAASMVWQQWRAVQVESAERSRSQSAWILQGALDWSRLILREDSRTGGADHLGEPWAVPLAEARLSTFLAADRDRTDDGPEAFLSGRIQDAQARFNLRNLVTSGDVSQADLRALQRLCELASVPASVAQTLAEGLRAAAGDGVPTASATPALVPQSFEQLSWLGVDEASLRALERYATLLPTRTPLNLNTAEREVIAAVVDGLDLASAERLVQARVRTPFESLALAQAQLPASVVLDAQVVGTSSRYFIVQGRLRLDSRVLEERSLIERRGLEIVALHRERIASVEDALR